ILGARNSFRCGRTARPPSLKLCWTCPPQCYGGWKVRAPFGFRRCRSDIEFLRHFLVTIVTKRLSIHFRALDRQAGLEEGTAGSRPAVRQMADHPLWIAPARTRTLEFVRYVEQPFQAGVGGAFRLRGCALSKKHFLPWTGWYF